MPVSATSLDLSGVKLLKPTKYSDNRGSFSEVYSRRDLISAGITVDFVQDNHSVSVDTGTVRGMHFQIPPFAQHKLVRVVRGSILDVLIDIRPESPTYGSHISVTISAEEGNQVYVPVGIAHGFMTLEPNTEVIYKVSDYYSPDHERGILWNDEDLRISWPQQSKIVISEKDKLWPKLRDLVPISSWQ
ncbi:dTDP-4-dehydrorhamnose 3,5-epimerase [Bradyrhizobium sp. SZCCHNRI3037]|uniref:dTDP-4-dehydrorhamnose 3,5-epimerase n=1 Tax=Bradyrhizobium sp. SZCCHNRI3037 TaxID=3057290 RepID=UPI002916CEA6|nr:dTDP-4-dehydrorhamnose 3,5-epimerase [Bradyrhizobium sp. SZCCHNRI3037]